MVVKYIKNKNNIYPIGVDYSNIEKLPTIDGILMQGNENIIHYGECSTESKADEKIIQCKGFKLINGSRIAVKFIYNDTSSNPKLKIEGTDAIPINCGKNFIKANVVYEFIYIDGQYILLNEEVSALRNYINNRFTYLDKQFVLLNEEIATLKNHINMLEDTLASIENRLSILEGKNG